MNKNLIILVLIFFNIGLGFAQVAINEDATDPDNSAMLDIKSTHMGLLIPRMNFTQMYRVEKPAIGLLIFNTSANTFYYYDGSNWTSLSKIIDKPNVKSINIKESLNLNPRSAPKEAKEGDVYMDANTHKLNCWNGKEWKELW